MTSPATPTLTKEHHELLQQLREAGPRLAPALATMAWPDRAADDDEEFGYHGEDQADRLAELREQGLAVEERRVIQLALDSWERLDVGEEFLESGANLADEPDLHPEDVDTLKLLPQLDAISTHDLARSLWPAADDADYRNKFDALRQSLWRLACAGLVEHIYQTIRMPVSTWSAVQLLSETRKENKPCTTQS